MTVTVKYQAATYSGEVKVNCNENDEVLKLTSAKELVEIKVNDDIVWSAIKRSYIGVICKSIGDFNLYIKEKGLKGKRQTTKILHAENKTYICFASVCDTCSWSIDNYYETELAKYNKEYSEIVKIIQSILPSVADS